MGGRSMLLVRRSRHARVTIYLRPSGQRMRFRILSVPMTISWSTGAMCAYMKRAGRRSNGNAYDSSAFAVSNVDGRD